MNKAITAMIKIFRKKYENYELCSTISKRDYDKLEAFFTEESEKLLQEERKEWVQELWDSIRYIPTARVYTGSYDEAYEDGWRMACRQIEGFAKRLKSKKKIT